MRVNGWDRNTGKCRELRPQHECQARSQPASVWSWPGYPALGPELAEEFLTIVFCAYPCSSQSYHQDHRASLCHRGDKTTELPGSCSNQISLLTKNSLIALVTVVIIVDLLHVHLRYQVTTFQRTGSLCTVSLMSECFTDAESNWTGHNICLKKPCSLQNNYLIKRFSLSVLEQGFSNYVWQISLEES